MKVALVGFGYWGPNHARVFSQLPGSGVSAIVEPDPGRAASALVSFPDTQVVGSVDELLHAGEAEAAILATPASTHEDLAVRLLEAGLHVLVEKPLAMSSAGCLRVGEVADSVGRVAMAGHTFIYNAAVTWLTRAVQDGTLGEVYYVTSQRLNLGRVRSDVNALWNFAPHDVSIILAAFDEFPHEVSAVGFMFLQDGVEDVVFLTMRFPSGRAAHVHISWLDPLKVRSMTVVGSDKMLVYDDTSQDAKITLYDRSIERSPTEGVPFADFAEFQLLSRSGDVHIPRLALREPLIVQAEHFIGCCRSGTRPITDAVSAARVVAVLEAADASIARGVPVRVTDPGEPA